MSGSPDPAAPPRGPTSGAWWHILLPDVRGWATIGMFVLVFYDLHLMATRPQLASNELFKTVSTLLLGSGAFGLVCSFLWGGSKASVAAADTVNALATSPVVTAPNAKVQTVNVTDPSAPLASDPAGGAKS